MRRDRIIAISDVVSRDVSIPLSLGALRPSETSTTWEDDTRKAFRQNERVVLSGDIENLASIAKSLASLREEFPTSRCGLLLHWKQALSQTPSAERLALFDAVHVALDETIDRDSLKTIESRWKPQWIVVPRVGFAWIQWIPSTLFSEKRGTLHVLVPKDDDSGILSDDEIRILFSELSLEHPLIHVRPVPTEWFVPSELGPWLQNERYALAPKIIHDSRTQSEYSHSVIVPFLWTGESDALLRLHTSLQSIAGVLKKSREIVIAVDRLAGSRELHKEDFPQLDEHVIVDLERLSSREDWRAGFIRNLGAEHGRNRHGHFIFIDSDVAIRQKSLFSEALANDFDLLQTTPNDKIGFEHASSSLIVVRSSLFRNLGGFSEAFHRYGCEDNHLVWQIERAKRRILRLDQNVFEHLRPVAEQDDVAAKMVRLRPSASLMYRMTLDPRVHRHFYSSLGNSFLSRAIVKRLYTLSPTRLLLGVLVFLATFFETENRTRYLVGFYDIAIWRLKHPLLWLKSHAWKLQNPWHFVRRNAWRIPHALMSVPRAARSLFGHAKIAAEIGVIKIRESRFGWNFVGWRLSLRLRKLRDRLNALQNPFNGLRGHLDALWGDFKWRPRVWWQRLVGNSNRLLGFLKRIFVVYLFVPIRYRLPKLGPVLWSKVLRAQPALVRSLERAHFLILKESRACYQKWAPIFYRWFWYPLFLKPIYFLRYHLVHRWRKP